MCMNMGTNRIAASLGRPGRTILVAAFSLMALASAKAQGTAEQRAACTPDAVRLCSAEIPNVARVTSCMRGNRAKLSAPCRLAFDNASPSRVHPGKHHRKTVVAYAHHHHVARHHRQTRSDEALSIAREVIAGFNLACQNRSMPEEFCDMAHSFHHSGKMTNFADFGHSADFNADMAAQYMNPQMMEGLIQSFAQ